MKTRKIVSLLALCTLVLSLFAVMPASAATNYLTDCIGFEGESYTSTSQFDGWTINSTAAAAVAAEVTADKACTGTKSLKVTILDGTTATQIAYTGVSALTADVEYKITMKVLIPESIAASTGTGGIQIRINNASNGAGGTTTSWLGGADYHYTGDAWREISGTFVATDSTNFAFRFRDGAVTNGVFYVDDIAVYSKEELEAEEKAEEEERAAKNFSYVSEYRKTLDDELYLDMENASDVTGTNAEFTVDTNVAHQGGGSMKMTLTSTETDYNNYIQAKALPTFLKDIQYEASVWVNIPENQTIGHVRLFIDLGAANSDVGRYIQRKVLLSTTNGEWIRISVPFTMTADDAPTSVRMAAYGTQGAYMYWDDLTIVQKQRQYSVLQLTKPLTLEGDTSMEADVTAPGAGAFTVQYDLHKASAVNAGKALIAGIYKDTGAGKQLVEIKIAIVSADASSVSIAMDGVETPDESYSLKVMYWDSLAGMFGYRTAEFTF